jgi:ATP-dependent Clp protease ATP-binding subunit ClpB
VARVIDRVAERGIEVTLTDDARTLLGDLGYDPTYGARPLRRVIQKQLTDRLALALLKGETREGDSVRVDVVGGELALETATAQTPGAQAAAV